MKTIKNNSQYKLEDMMFNGVVFSKTTLWANQSTNGHSHKETDEIYIFTRGDGILLIDEKMVQVSSGDMHFIDAGRFHKVMNTSFIDGCNLEFYSIFKPYGERGINPIINKRKKRGKQRIKKQ